MRLKSITCRAQCPGSNLHSPFFLLNEKLYFWCLIFSFLVQMIISRLWGLSARWNTYLSLQHLGHYLSVSEHMYWLLLLFIEYLTTCQVLYSELVISRILTPQMSLSFSCKPMFVLHTWPKVIKVDDGIKVDKQMTLKLGAYRRL